METIMSAALPQKNKPSLPQIKVEDLMDTRFHSITKDTKVEEAVSMLVKHAITGLVVVSSSGEPVGFFSEKEALRRFLATKYMDFDIETVGEHMDGELRFIPIGSNLFEVIEKFVSNSFHCYPVLDNNKVVGIISRRAVLKSLATQPYHTW